MRGIERDPPHIWYEILLVRVMPQPDYPPTRDARVPFEQRLTCTVAEACQATGLGRTKLYGLIGAGHLSTITIGRRRLVLVRSLLELFSSDEI